MSHLRTERELTVILKLDEQYAKKTQACLKRVLSALDKLPAPVFHELVNAGVADNLLALRTAINDALEGN